MHLTQSGAILGTPAYMAPEQGRGQAVDHRADLFSLGVLLYEMTTGKRPFTGNDTMSILTSLAIDEPAAPQQINSALPAALSSLVMRLLSKKPESRPASGHAVAEELLGVLTNASRPIVEALPPLLPQAAPPVPEAQLATAVEYPAVDPWGGIDVPDPKAATQTVLSAQEAAAPASAVREPNKSGVIKMAFAMALVLLLLGGGFAAFKLYFERKDASVVAEVVKKEEPQKGPKPEAPAPAPKDLPSPNAAHERWASQVAELPRNKQIEAVMAKLEEVNPGCRVLLSCNVPGCDWSEKGYVILYVRGAADLSPVRALPWLRRLWADGNQLSDLSPLRGMKLTELSIPGTQVTDLSPLEKMPLKRLNISQTPVANLSALRGAPLESLNFAGSKVIDLSPIHGLPLGELEVDGTAVADLSPLKGMKLHTLRCSTMRGINDLSPLKELPLRRLICGLDLSPVLRAVLPNELNQHTELLRSIATLQSINGILARGVALQFEFDTPRTEIPTLKTDAAGEITVEALITNRGHNEVGVIGTPNFSLRISGNGYPRTVFNSGNFSANLAAPVQFWALPNQPELRSHMAAVKSKDRLSFYLNGKRIDSVELLGPVKLDAVETFALGGASPTWFHEIRVSKIARYSEDFTPQARFEPDADTLALYHCDEGKGDLLKDCSGNKHNVKLQGATWAHGILDLPRQ